MKFLFIITTAFFILTSSTPYAEEQNQLPSLEKKTDERALTTPAYIVGQYWFRQLTGSPSYINFPPAYNYLRTTLGRLLPHTNLVNKRIELGLLNSSNSNAFVLPGNHLFLYSDIINLANTEDKLLALLGHEIAHLDLDHYERQKQNDQQERNKAILTMGAGIAAMIAGADVDAASALWMGGAANNAENSLAYNRDQEKEADRIARYYLAKADIPEAAMNQLFLSFFRESIGTQQVEYLSTHPIAKNRVSDSFNVTESTSILRQNQSNEFNYFKATLITYRALLTDAPVQYIENRIFDKQLKHYSHILRLILTDKDIEADWIEQLDESQSFEAYLKATVLLSQNNTEQGIQLVNRKLSLDPENTQFKLFKSQFNQTKPSIRYDSNLFEYEKRQLLDAKIVLAEIQRNLPLSLSLNALKKFNYGDGSQSISTLKKALSLAENKDKIEIEDITNHVKNILDRQKELNLPVR